MRSPAQRRALLVLLARDGVIIGLTLGLWQSAQTLGWLGPEASWLGATALAMLSVLCGFLIHEWGHLLGAVAAGASLRLPTHPFASPFLFRFDAVGNSREQFALMSAGGFVISAVVVIALVLYLPLQELAGQLTLGLVLLGVAATFVIEVPEFWRVWRGQPIPTTAAYFSPDDGD